MFFCARRCFFLEQVAAVVKPISLVLKVDATMENLLAVEVASQVRICASSVAAMFHLFAFTCAVLAVGQFFSNESASTIAALNRDLDSQRRTTVLFVVCNVWGECASVSQAVDKACGAHASQAMPWIWWRWQRLHFGGRVCGCTGRQPVECRSDALTLLCSSAQPSKTARPDNSPLLS